MVFGVEDEPLEGFFVPVDPDPDPEPEPPCGCVLCGVLLGVVVVVCEEVVVGDVLVVGLAAHDSETDWTGPVTGSLIDERGVPGGTLTVKTTFWPPTIVTVTTQVSAEDALGSAAMANAADKAAVRATTRRFRLLSTVA